jgi:hypothetical protein
MVIMRIKYLVLLLLSLLLFRKLKHKAPIISVEVETLLTDMKTEIHLFYRLTVAAVVIRNRKRLSDPTALHSAAQRRYQREYRVPCAEKKKI